jgi:hypothetical protein
MKAVAVAGISSIFALLAACTTTRIVEVPTPQDGGASSSSSSGGTDGGATNPDGDLERVEGKSGKLFGATAKSFAKVKPDGTVAKVGVDIPLAGLTAGPLKHEFQDDLVLEMPAVAKEQTIINHLRANWLATGHGPTPYGDPHFDFHFLRGTVAEIDGLVCRSDTTMPTADKLPPGYGTPELCVSAMGYHSWPKEDLSSGKFTGSLIMGYWKGNVIFVEPMIPISTFEKKATFEISVPKPASAGGKTTLYPTRMVANWDAATEVYSFEFDTFETID